MRFGRRPITVYRIAIDPGSTRRTLARARSSRLAAEEAPRPALPHGWRRRQPHRELCVPEARALPRHRGRGRNRSADARAAGSGAGVTAIEVDPELVGLLRERSDLAGATIVQADALEFDYDAHDGEACWCVAGNSAVQHRDAADLALARTRQSRPARIVAMVQERRRRPLHGGTRHAPPTEV